MFFIRYGRGEDLHIRLRLLLHRSALLENYVEAIRTLAYSACAVADAPPDEPHPMIWMEPYDRTAEYFGESLASIYSELLNEQTSYISLRLLRATYGRPVALQCSIAYLLFHLISCVGCDEKMCIERSIALARRIIVKETQKQPEQNDNVVAAVAAAVNRNRAIFAAGFEFDLGLHHLSRLLSRAMGTVPHVVTHSLHLLCNKSGLSMWSEYQVLISVRSLLVEGK